MLFPLSPVVLIASLFFLRGGRKRKTLIVFTVALALLSAWLLCESFHIMQEFCCSWKYKFKLGNLLTVKKGRHTAWASNHQSICETNVLLFKPPDIKVTFLKKWPFRGHSCFTNTSFDKLKFFDRKDGILGKGENAGNISSIFSCFPHCLLSYK